MNDLRHAVRSLAKTPAYTAIALATLALGIGVNTSMVSIVDALLFRSAPYPDVDRLVQVTRSIRTGAWVGQFSEQELREIQPAEGGFSSLTAYDRTMYTMADPGQPPERVLGVRFTSGVSETLRVSPLLGRAFVPDEFQPGKDQVAMLTETSWRSRFGADPKIVGRTLRLDGEIVTIIGVIPARFEYRMYWGNVAFWRPLNFTPDQLKFRGYRQFWLLGRLQPGVTSELVTARLATLGARQEREFPQDYPGVRYELEPLHHAALDDTRRNLSWMLLGLAGFVLLIACANLANLQLARATASMREFSIRAALGASRRRLISQQLSESVLLSLTGGTLGFVVALWLNSLAEHAILIDGALGFKATMDGRILLAAFLVSLVTGVAFGIAPAFLASRVDLVAALKAQSRGSTPGRGQQRLRHALIVGEVALALVLLGGAAIVNRGFQQMLARETGWETSRVLTAILPIPETRYPSAAQRTEFFRQLEDKLAAIPGVEHAALSTSLPLLQYSFNREVFLDAPAGEGGGANPVAAHYMITPDYFAAMGIRLLEGRTFGRDLTFDSPQYVLVNETLARQFWPRQSAIGQRLGGLDEGRPIWREVIGVVRDVEPAASVAHPTTRLAVYRPLVQEPWSYVNVVLRTAPAPGDIEGPLARRAEALAGPLRRAIADLDPDLAPDSVVTVREFVSVAQNNVILGGKMLLGFAALGLGLAAIGLYGVISHTVAQRMPEFGIRLALGALPADILRHVLARGVWLTALGLAIGLAGAIALGRLLASIMPRLASVDVVSLGGVALLLFAVTLLACWFPARRATKVDPLTALRAE